MDQLQAYRACAVRRANQKAGRRRPGRALTSVTVDFWTRGSKHIQFNLYNGTVVYKGHIVDQTDWPGNADKGYMMVVNVYPTFCSEFHGIQTVKYDIQGLTIGSNAPVTLTDVQSAVTGDPQAVSAQSGDHNLGKPNWSSMACRLKQTVKAIRQHPLPEMCGLSLIKPVHHFQRLAAGEHVLKGLL